MDVTPEQRRAAVLVGAVLVVTLILAGLAVVLLRSGTEPEGPARTPLSAADQSELLAKTEQFMEVTGNYGLNPEILSEDDYLSYMDNAGEFALLTESTQLLTTSLATYNELTPEFFTSDSDFVMYQDRYYSLYLVAELKTIRAANVEVAVPEEGFQRDNVPHANVEVTFDSTETIRVKNAEGPEWAGIVEIKERTTREELTLTFRRDPAGWRLLSAEGLKNPSSISLLQQDRDAVRSEYVTVDTWDTGVRAIPDDHTPENTFGQAPSSTEGS